MVKVTNKQILSISAGLSYLNQRETEAWYQIDKNLTKISPLIEEINRSKKMLFDKMALKDEEGKIKYKDEEQTKIDFGDNFEKADNMWKQIQDEEVEVDFHTFDIKLLEGVKLNSNFIRPLFNIIIIDSNK